MRSALRRNIYWCWEVGKETIAIIYLADDYERRVFPFRDEIINQVLQNNLYIIGKSEGKPTQWDSVVRLFEKEEDKEALNQFFREKPPGLVASILKTRQFKAWRNRLSSIQKTAKFTVETSHDHQCIDIHSMIHEPSELLEIVKRVADVMHVQIYEDKRAVKYSPFIAL